MAPKLRKAISYALCAYQAVKTPVRSTVEGLFTLGRNVKENGVNRGQNIADSVTQICDSQANKIVIGIVIAILTCVGACILYCVVTAWLASRRKKATSFIKHIL